MKGYVQVKFTQEEVYKVLGLARQIDDYNCLDREEKFRLGVEVRKFLFWEYKSKTLSPNISDALCPYFRHVTFDDDFYGCELSSRGRQLIALAKLVKNNPVVLLGDELCGIVNFLRNREYI